MKPRLNLAHGLWACLLLAVGGSPAAAQVPVAAPAADPVAAAPPPESANNYVIGHGDTIQVFVWRTPELSVTVPVRPDGKISTPLVEDMEAIGKTPSQLARDIETVLSEYVRSPKVNIIVSNAQSAFNQIKVIGQVGKPQAVPYREGMTVLDVVLAVGGLSEFAAGNRAKILRKDEKGQEKQLKVKLDSLVRKGDLEENVAMKPGDVLLVPEAMF